MEPSSTEMLQRTCLLSVKSPLPSSSIKWLRTYILYKCSSWVLRGWTELVLICYSLNVYTMIVPSTKETQSRWCRRLALCLTEFILVIIYLHRGGPRDQCPIVLGTVHTCNGKLDFKRSAGQNLQVN